MISATKAIQSILNTAKSYGTEPVDLNMACGRVLAEAVRADRDIPPYDRATMDGIAIRYADSTGGFQQFPIAAVQAAGDQPITAIEPGSCVQIMTGAAVPDLLDTVIPIECLAIANSVATIETESSITAGQYIHRQAADKLAGEVLIASGQLLTPADIPIAATVGKTQLLVSKLPKVVVITTGDELVAIDAQPSDNQVRQSNNYAVQAVLGQYGVTTDMIHLADNQTILRKELKHCLRTYDVVIISGGVSKGEFDYIPQVLNDLSVEMKFHGVKQKPGKPLWFGAAADGTVVFALPGNPVSTFLCIHAYVLPWLRSCLNAWQRPIAYAVLDQTVDFAPPLDYFLQVSLHTDQSGRLMATPLKHNGSGDFINLSMADAFIELPASKKSFKKGTAYKILTFGTNL